MTKDGDTDPPLDPSAELLQRVLDAVDEPIFMKDLSHRWVAFNEKFCSWLGHPYEALIGKSDFDFWPPEEARVFWEKDDVVFASGEAHENVELATGKDGVQRTIWTRKYPVRDEAGRVIGLCGITTDITNMKQSLQKADRLEAENRLQLSVIEAQRALLETLAVPVIQVWQGVLLLPIVGALTAERQAQVTGSVLEAISRAGARFLIVDVTGVPMIDSMAATALVLTVQAATLLGCESVLVGIGPTAAPTLVGLDVDLGRLVTLSTLERAIQYALGRLSYKIVRAEGA